MPGLVKIGKTTQSDVEARMKQLYGTGVPVPFDCAFACQVNDATEVERGLHIAFGGSRLNPNREFFKIEAERVIAILKLLRTTEVTTQVENAIEADVSNADKASAETLKRSRRPKMNFHALGIPNSSILTSTVDQSKTATVTDVRKVMFEGTETSLTAATRKVLELAEDYALQPSPYWTFNGKNLKDIYDEHHGSEDES
jgi:hypothetical protein